ncbi:MAG: hypothetical protein GY716_09965 [bacterium]|nr:hypothetical protein [bacterium]
MGDPCDLCSDADGDGFGRPASDECVAGNVEDCNDSSAEAFPGGLERCDGLDNDCSGAVDDLICSQYEVNVDGEIDGIELTWVGRAFGECSVDPRLEWWGAADYSADGCVDGDDLVLLADAWGCRGDMPVCEDP